MKNKKHCHPSWVFSNETRSLVTQLMKRDRRYALANDKRINDSKEN